VTELGAGREFDLIRALVARWGPERAAGVGDDAAVLDVPRGEQLVASVDTAIEGRHFRLEWLSLREIGYRAVAAALSDLAAMAARPLGVLVALALPDGGGDDLSALADGIGDAIAAADTRIVGGNIARANALSITTTVLGSAYRPLRRDAVKPGDGVYVTGALGGPGAALRALVAGRTPSPEHFQRFRRPAPRLAEARWLAARGATAAIDISDGLAADLGHLAAASALRIAVDLDALPLVAGVTALEAAASGEEYELVVAASGQFDVGEFADRFVLPLTRIGVAGAGDAEVVLTQRGVRVASPGGHDHLSS
jgi:thiamine-monophosphate kinase